MRIRDFVRKHGRALGLASIVVGLAGLLQFTGVNPAASQTMTLTAFGSNEDPGLDASSAVWANAPQVQVPLTAQAASYAAGGGSIPTVAAKAIHYQDKIYLRVEWADNTKDETTSRVQDFSDAVAVEFPSQASAGAVPALCMGQLDAGVNIWQWRADSEAGVKDPVDLYVGALVDGYPSKDTLFYTARAAGNPYADTAAGPVQTLVSHAFGTLSKANTQDVAGKGVYDGKNWAVVFQRTLSAGDVNEAAFTKGATTDMAFAVWNGSEGDRNGRKSVSQFVRLSLSGTEIVSDESNPLAWALVAALFVGFVGVGVGLGLYGYKEAKRR